MKKDFLFVNLQALMDAKWIDGMAAGAFTDMWGYEFEIKPEDLAEYVLKTRMALQSTRDAAGNVIGFPIDAMNHNRGEAAGWITDVQQLGGVVQIMPRWTELGRQLVASDQMRYFSPTIDLSAKVIMGGSLTNWPATRTADHQLLLSPVELSVQLETLPEMGLGQRIEMILDKAISGLAAKLPGVTKPDTGEPEPEQSNVEVVDMDFANLTQEQKDLFLSQARTELTSGTLPVEMQALVETRAAAIAEAQIATESRRVHIADLSASLTGGTDARPQGLPIPVDELAEFLTSLSPEAQAKAEGILSRIHEAGLIDFKEHGSSRVQTGIAVFPPEMAAQLTIWQAAGQTIEDFFKVNAVELGAMADYNLTEFIKENK
jgi:hypothetical protein